MTAPRFRNLSERMYADYLTHAGLAYQYEKPWGKFTPDFTIEKGTAATTPIAIADVKDLRLSEEDEAALAAGQMIHFERQSADRTRQQIFNVWRQFKECSDYPCILVLAPAGDRLPAPQSVMEAMLGDLTLTIPVSRPPVGTGKATWSFGTHGKMVNKEGNARNTRITAIGLLSRIIPGDVVSGLNARIRALAQQLKADGTDGEEALRQLVAAHNDLRAKLVTDGYDLETAATQVEYVINPLAAKPFPKADLVKGYVRVWEYDLTSQSLAMTYDWAKLSKPQLP